VLLWSLRGLWNPVVLGLAVAYLVWPHRRHPAVSRLLVVVGALVALWILAEARSVVYPALAALLIAALLDPVVDRLETQGLRRPLAALLVLVPLLAVVALVLLVLLPPLVDQLGRLLGRIPSLLVSFYEDVLLPAVRRWMPGLPSPAGDLWKPLFDGIGGVVGALGQGLSGLGRMVQAGLMVFLTPVLTYYFLVDLDRWRQRILGYLPPERRRQVDESLALFGNLVGRYLRGQLLVSLVLAVVASTAFALLGLPYALVVGLAVGVLNIVPVVGFWVSLVLALLAGLTAPAPWGLLLKTALVFLGLQILEGHVLSPRVLGRQLGVNPGLLLVAMLGLALFLGLLGLVLAAPLLAFLVRVLPHPPFASEEPGGSPGSGDDPV
jgi:predicted PurR-regulated permease PerM